MTPANKGSHLPPEDKYLLHGMSVPHAGSGCRTNLGRSGRKRSTFGNGIVSVKLNQAEPVYRYRTYKRLLTPHSRRRLRRRDKRFGNAPRTLVQQPERRTTRTNPGTGHPTPTPISNLDSFQAPLPTTG